MKRVVLTSLSLLLLAGVSSADSASDAGDVVTTMVTALADDNLAGFMKPIDPAMPGYAKVRSQVSALIARAQVSSSISILENEGDDAKRVMQLDWYIEIRSREVGDKTEPRRKSVRCVVQKQGKSWRVVELDPAGLFE